MNIDNIIFKAAQKDLRTTISCISGHWFVVKKTSRYLDLLYVKRNNDYLSCELSPLSSDLLESCGKSGKLNNKSEYCNSAFMELLFSLSS